MEKRRPVKAGVVSLVEAAKDVAAGAFHTGAPTGERIEHRYAFDQPRPTVFALVRREDRTVLVLVFHGEMIFSVISWCRVCTAPLS